MTPVRPVPGGRFWPDVYSYAVDVRAEYVRGGGDSTAMLGMGLVETLDNPETRRLIVDGEQASIFAEMNTHPPIDPILRMPFDQLYVEFTGPVEPSEPEPGYSDEIIAVVLTRFKVGTTSALYLAGGEGGVGPEIAHCWIIYREKGRDNLVAASTVFNVSLERGLAMGTLRHFTDELYGKHGGDLSLFPNGPQQSEPVVVSARPPSKPDAEYPDAPTRATGRRDLRGFYERRLFNLGVFVSWLLTYMTAKGIVIVEEPLTRQQRRARARSKHRPRPWHIVTVEPTRIGEEQGGEGSGPGFRYDVRGHLRFGRHPRRDGTYSQTVEWVRPHQRGLKHSLYIPKTYHYEGDALG